MDFFLDGTGRLRTLWRLSSYGVAFLVINVAVNLVLAVLIAVYLMAEGTLEQSSLEVIQQQLEQRLHDNLAVLMTLAAPPMVGGMVLATWIWRRFLDRRSFASLGFVRPRFGLVGSVIGGTVLGMSVLSVGAFLAWRLGGFRLEGVALHGDFLWLLPTLVLMAFMEEIMFRGYVLQNFLDIRRPLLGVVLSSLVFWLVHSFNPSAWTNPWVGLNIFSAGLLLSLAYLISRELWLPTAMHFGWNYAQGPLLNIPVSGMKIQGLVQLEPVEGSPQWLNGGEFGLEASGVLFVVQAVAITTLYLLWRKTGPRCESMASQDETIVRAELVESADVE